jgi:hypothetical protein
MGDTGRVSRRTVAAGILALLMVAGPAGADPVNLNAKVVWAHGGRAYLASSDPLSLAEGDMLKFYDGKKVAAEGSVTSIVDGTLAVARIKSGSLESVKKLDRLRITADHPKLRPVDVMRIGIPSRSNLLFACGTPSIRSPLPRAAFSGEALSVRSFLLARDKSDPTTAQWPDTLLVRLFDEATDEEIALERGELDVAVFWPGELSTQMRENPRWREFTYGMRPRSILTATLSREAAEFPLAASDSSALLWMNEAVFRGDLLPWDRGSGGPVLVGPPTAKPAPLHRFEIDRGVPGWQTIEKALRSAGASGSDTGSAPVRVSLLGVSATPPDPALFSFAIRCPVVCKPGLRTYLNTLGTDAFINIVDCSIAGSSR